MNFWLLTSAFSFALTSTLLNPIFFPFLKLNFFAPYLVILLYKKSHIAALWQALLAGLTLDLLAAATPFGFWSANYLFTLVILMRLKQFFFEDKFLTIPLLTLIFSLTSTLLFALSTHFFFNKIHFNLSWVLTDFFAYPIFDSLYALIAFNLPIFYLAKLFPQKKRGVQSFRLNEN